MLPVLIKAISKLEQSITSFNGKSYKKLTLNSITTITIKKDWFFVKLFLPKICIVKYFNAK